MRQEVTVTATKTMKMVLCRPVVFCLLVCGAGGVQAQASAPAASAPAAATGAGFVSGLQPDRRPQGFPVKGETAMEDKKAEAYLSGVSRPWPGNIEQIVRTGEWFVPLRHRGMTGPYDIRQWHGGARPAS